MAATLGVEKEALYDGKGNHINLPAFLLLYKSGGGIADFLVVVVADILLPLKDWELNQQPTHYPLAPSQFTCFLLVLLLCLEIVQ